MSSRYFREAFYKFLDKLNIEHVEPYTLRHTFATRMYEAGVPMKTIQAWMGHKSIKTTSDTYTHVLDETMRSAAALLDEYLTRIQTN